MQTLISFIVRLVDLVEAEAKSAKRHIFRLGLALALAWAAVVIALCSAGLFVAAVVVALNQVVHVAWALAIVAAMLLALGAVCGIVAKLVLQRRPS